MAWSKVSGYGITYTVCYSTTSGTQSDPPSEANCGTSGITGTSTTLGPLSRGTTYYIWVAAVSSGGTAPYSDRRESIAYNGMILQCYCFRLSAIHDSKLTYYNLEINMLLFTEIQG